MCAFIIVIAIAEHCIFKIRRKQKNATDQNLSIMKVFCETYIYSVSIFQNDKNPNDISQ